MECELNEQGRLKFKIEQSRFFDNHYRYVYDLKGHLLAVYKNDRLVEEYEYNELGQRAQQYSAENPPAVYLKYNAKGQLIRMDDTLFEYDKYGALNRKIYDPPHCIGSGETLYFYNGDTKLDKVILPSDDEITYKYGRGEDMQAQSPLQKFKNGKLVREYEWFDPFRLAACLDHEKQLEFHFSYGERICPKSVRLKEYLPRPNQAEFLCGCDQVGTLKVLSSSPNELLTHIDYDSFGNVLSDAAPRLQLPIGFAGGLVDHDTGLVRFGYRDYNPTCGRFTCPDPMGDTGGDHDLYDYCVDDPVSMVDTNGLESQSALRWLRELGGLPRIDPQDVKYAGGGAAYGGLFGAGHLADIFSKPGVDVSEEFTRDVNSVWPKVWDVINISLGNKPGPWGQKVLEDISNGVGKTIDKSKNQFMKNFE